MRLYAIAAFTVAAVFFFARIYVTKRNINLILSQQIEIPGKEEVFYSLIFGNSGVNIIVSSDKTSQIKYEDINKIIDTPKDFVFIRKHSFFIICQKDNLKSDEKEKIYEIIKRMNIKLVRGK